MLGYLLSTLLYLFTAVSLVGVPHDEVSLLVITVVYPNGEGVGVGHPVWLGKAIAGTEVLSFTNENSQTAYNVVYGTWIAWAEIPPTHPFLIYVCTSYVVINAPAEYLIIHCYERFFMRIPWLSTLSPMEKG